MKANLYFLSYLVQFFLEWKMFQKKKISENQNPHFMFNKIFSENRAVYATMWKNIV